MEDKDSKSKRTNLSSSPIDKKRKKPDYRFFAPQSPIISKDLSSSDELTELSTSIQPPDFSYDEDTRNEFILLPAFDSLESIDFSIGSRRSETHSQILSTSEG